MTEIRVSPDRISDEGDTEALMVDLVDVVRDARAGQGLRSFHAT